MRKVTILSLEVYCFKPFLIKVSPLLVALFNVSCF